MPDASVDRRTRLRDAADAFARTSMALGGVLLIVRAYEWALVARAHALPPGVAGLVARGLADDTVVALWAAAALAAPVIGLAQVAPAAGRQLHRAAAVALTLVAVALAQYFAVTAVPLGADLFGYSPRDAWRTAAASGGLGAGALVALVGFAALAWWSTGAAARRRWPGWSTGALLGAATVAAVRGTALRLAPSSYASDLAFYVVSNKTAYFADRVLAFSAERARPTRAAVGAGAYPFMHAAPDTDVLGPFFRVGPTRPNVVIIVVEGLGRDFVGDGARYGGFMPFLDSLTTRSLYWENFLSNSGRTFGVLPSLLASLPPTPGGFMELGADMPRHLSLVRALGDQGYATTFFSGSDGHFDLIDTFMDRQHVGRFVDQTAFGPGYEKAPPGAGGFSWGFADADLFRRALDIVGPDTAQAAAPRLDIYLTMTSHEPFIPPHAAEYRATFARRLAALPIDAARRAEIARTPDVFSTLLYTDDAVAGFMRAYARRADYARTIFVITGDHRLIPVPEATRLDRYHVPFLVFSPMLKAPQRFASVSSHLDVTPTLLAFLHHNYGVPTPARVPWVGTGIDTARALRNVHRIPLARTKAEFDDYLAGDRFMSAGRLYAVEDGLRLRERSAGDPGLDSLRTAFDQFRAVARYATATDHVYPGAPVGAPAPAAAPGVIDDPRERAREDALLAAPEFHGLDTDQLFVRARDRAAQHRYGEARLIARFLLRRVPNLHDARALLGRTYAFEGRYAEARPILDDVVRRAPQYLEGRVARVSLELWAGDAAAAARLADEALATFPQRPELLMLKTRALLARRAATPAGR